MKKISHIIIILCILCSVLYIKSDLSYCDKISAPKSQLIYDYSFNELTKISDEIYLLSKTVIGKDYAELYKKEEEYRKEIRFIISKINSLILRIQKQYDTYKNDRYTLNGLYATTLMLEEFRFSLTLLEEYIIVKDTDEKYYNLQSFFIVNSQANSKLRAAKEMLKGSN